MAKVLTTHVAAREPASKATWVLLAVSVAVLTVIAISVPRLVQPSGWSSGEKFLFLALVGYLGASLLYVLSVALRQPSLAPGGVALTRGAFLLHTCAVIARWVASGHAPLSNIYEMVLIFSWAVTALQLVAEWKYDLRFLGAITLPIAALSLVLMQVLPGEMRPLVPALQSTWLQIHVTLAMLSYAGLTISFALALLYLTKDGVSPRTFLTWTAGLVAIIYGSIVLTSLDGSLSLLMPAWDPLNNEKVMLGPKQALMVPLSSLGWPFLLVLGSALATFVLNLFDSNSAKPSPWGSWAEHLFLGSLFAQVVSLVLLLGKVKSGPYFVPTVGQSFAVHLSASPFLLAGIVSALFATLAWRILSWKYDPIVEYLPQRETLDALIYRTIAISFPLLTLMIIAGAYWANRTWGSYWSWDPKEDWALITWLTYAGYIHMRLTRGWRGRRSAYFAIIGFAIVMFTFFGVSYLLPGLHAYA
jgi:ABC-type transport system involved in cytochrome c biogenesis permease subunit